MSEEKRRLLSVAMTRAKDELHLMVPQRFVTHGQNAKGGHAYASRTQFISQSLLPAFERASWRPALSVAERAAAQGPRVGIGTRMRGMWR